MKSQIAQHLKVIKENSVDLISEKEIVDKLENFFRTKKPLKLKIGFDPTAKDIHLGHTVLLRKLRKLQDLGHQVCLIIGDFTAKIGDPSDKTTLRPVLSDKEIKSNAVTYTKQAFKILNKKKTKVVYNSIWYKNMSLANFLSLLSTYTIARVLERDDFSRRMQENKPLTILEVIYPLIQGYDSCKLGADIEFGGTDQKFNLIVGRHLQQAFGQIPQAVVTMPILVGLDGKDKMSKSLGNYIGVTDEPKDMFGKIMSISDEVMWEYIRLLSNSNVEEFKNLHPKEAKSIFAQEIVSFYHSTNAAEKEAREFDKVFSKKQLPENIPEYKTRKKSVNLIELLYESKMVSSKNEARRLLSQGSISATTTLGGGFTVEREQNTEIPPEGKIIRVGKRRYKKYIP